MMAKYAGKIINGKPTFLEPLESVALPENAEITIYIELSQISRPVKLRPKKESLTPTQEAASRFLKATTKIREQGFTAEDEEAFKKLESGEYKLKFNDRGLDS